MSDWQDRIVGVRMSVDRTFNDRIEASSFSRQQWGLVMTATEFEIENPEDAENARIVANTDKLSSVLPEMDRIEEQMGAMGGGGGGSSNGGIGGVLTDVKNLLGIGGSDGGGSKNDQRASDARALTQAYADELQRELEESGRWDEIRQLAADDQ